MEEYKGRCAPSGKEKMHEYSVVIWSYYISYSCYNAYSRSSNCDFTCSFINMCDSSCIID